MTFESVGRFVCGWFADIARGLDEATRTPLFWWLVIAAAAVAVSIAGT